MRWSVFSCARRRGISRRIAVFSRKNSFPAGEYMRETTRCLRLLAVLLVAFAGSAHASYHLWLITQLYSNADGTVQYVELKAYGGGEQFLRGHSITSSKAGTTHSFTFPVDLPGDTAVS